MKMEVGIREFRSRLSHWLEDVGRGGELVLTDRGRPIARVTPIAADASIDRLVADGIIRLPTRQRRRADAAQGVPARGSVAELVAEQRR